MICELLNRVMNSEPSLTGRIDCILCLQFSILYFFVLCSCSVYVQKIPKCKNRMLPFRTIYVVKVGKCSQVQNPKFCGWEPWGQHLITDLTGTPIACPWKISGSCNYRWKTPQVLLPSLLVNHSDIALTWIISDLFLHCS